MSEKTKIQWCDSTINPVMGCAGCELFPPPGTILKAIDDVLGESLSDWTKGKAKGIFKELIAEAYDAIETPKPGHINEVTTTNIWHFRELFTSSVAKSYGAEAEEAARVVIAKAVTCYAAKLHTNRGRNLLTPERGMNKGYATTFEQVTPYPGRFEEDAAKFSDLLGKTDPERPWIDGLPRLIFVSDMGDAFSYKKHFEFLKNETLPIINSEEGKRHLWLWLTKRPDTMAKFANEIGGLPENICAMTTVTGPDKLYHIDNLRAVKATMRGLSLEPLWERIPPEDLNLEGIDWLILGGESGSKMVDTRPFPIEWVNELREHCERKGVAFFLKQLGRRPTLDGAFVKLKDAHGGDWNEWPDDSLKVREFPQAFHDYRKGEPFDKGLRRKPKAVKVALEPLPDEENDDFKELDKVISKFAQMTVDAAVALYEIRNRRLYRAKFKTFEDYCQSKHNMSRQYANKLISAGKIHTEMETIVSKMGLPAPTNESQLRELGRLKDNEDRVEVYAKVVESVEADGGKITAAKLAQAVDAKLATSKSSERPSKLPPARRLAEARPLLDELEAAIPEASKEVFKKLRELLG